MTADILLTTEQLHEISLGLSALLTNLPMVAVFNFLSLIVSTGPGGGTGELSKSGQEISFGFYNKHSEVQ